MFQVLQCIQKVRGRLCLCIERVNMFSYLCGFVAKYLERSVPLFVHFAVFKLAHTVTGSA